MKVREVAGGGRAVEIAPERLARWFAGFAEQGGGIARTVLTGREVQVLAVSGSTATAAVPFPPLRTHADGQPDQQAPDQPDQQPQAEHEGLAVDALVTHACQHRCLGLVLVRSGAHSVGVLEGTAVVASRTDRHYQQGRTAAGGRSQRRYARRREQQARKGLREAAADIAEVLGARVGSLDAVVLGGDRGALRQLRADPRLTPVFELAAERVLDVAEPRRRVLDEAAGRARAVEVVVRDP